MLKIFAVIHRNRRPVISIDNEMIKGRVVSWIIWTYQITKGTRKRTSDIS